MDYKSLIYKEMGAGAWEYGLERAGGGFDRGRVSSSPIGALILERTRDLFHRCGTQVEGSFHVPNLHRPGCTGITASTESLGTIVGGRASSLRTT
jgi:hypothetical protein